jgi:hypothetical protein
MKTRFYPAFMTYDFGDSNPVFVVPHATTSLEYTPRGDIGADLLAVQLAKQIGTKAVISSIPREHEFGIDFNRLPPPERLAIEMFETFAKDEDKDKISEYEKRYAWVSGNRKDYVYKLKTYNAFWSTVGRFCKKDTLLIFLHVQSPMLRNFPSIIDVIPFSRFMGIDKAVDETNKRFEKKFEKIKKDFVEFSVFHTKHIYANSVLQKFGTTDPKAFSGSTKENHEKMLERLKVLGFADIGEELKRSYSLEKNLKAIEHVGNLPLRITCAMNFTGSLALGTQKFLKKSGATGIELEVSDFLSEIRTDLGIDVINYLAELLVHLNTKSPRA